MANYSIGTNLEPVTNVGSRSKAARKKRDEARKKAESAIEEAEGLAGGGALAIEQGAEKGCRVVALEPGRGPGDQGEARGVALRKSVLAKAADLLEHALGEFARDALAYHA